LQAGTGSASVIAQIADLNRITSYEALKRLSKKGFVKIRAKKNSSIKYFVPVDIAVLKDKLESKKIELDESIKIINEYKFEFGALFASDDDKPTVLFFEGKEGIKSVLQDTLKQSHQEILSFSSAESLEEGFDNAFLNNYWKKRVALGIPTRGLLPKTSKAMSLFNPERNLKELRRLKFVDSKVFNFKNEIDIYGSDIGIISYEKGKEHGVIIRSKSIADSMRSVFEVLWLQN